MTTITTIADATKLVQDFYAAKKNSLAQRGEANETFKVDSRKRTYRMIGEAAGVILKLMADQKVFGELCVKYGTKPAGEGENPYSPGIRILFRKKEGGKDVFDRSAWKYGKSIRYGLEQGWKPDQFEDNLENLELNIDGKKVKRMIAAELQDTKNHGDKDAQATLALEIAAQGFMARQPGIGTFGANLAVDAPKNGQLVNVVASYDATSGQWIVRALANADHDRAWASIKKDVLASFQKARDELATKIAEAQLSREHVDVEQLLADLDAHNVETSALNATVGTQRKMVVWEQTHDGLFAMPSEHVVPVTDQDEAAQETPDSNAA